MSRTIVVTGVTRGLGRAMVEQFVATDASVFGCGRSSDGVRSLQEKFGDHCFTVVDVSDDASVGAWHEKIGPLDVDLLINNAAIINPNAELWKVPPDQFSKLIDINIKGVYHVLRHFVPGMIRRRSGVIVNFSSGWGRSTSPHVAPYCASKWAIEGLTKSLAQELPVGMAAVALNPGVIHTDMLDICFGGEASGFESPEQWARRAVPMLLGLGASDNGQSMTVD